jgi:hypothetical protein
MVSATVTARNYTTPEGRGPIGEVVVTMRSPLSAKSPNWAPAFAGVDKWVGRAI